MKLNLLVLKTKTPKLLKQQYELLGFGFDYHNHGNGPMHYASESFGFVFEIYPSSTESESFPEPTRLGFVVKNLQELWPTLECSNWNVISEPKSTEWGFLGVIQDLDGRKVELKEA